VVSGSELNTYKPASVLLLEGKHANAGLSRAAAKEFIRRFEEDRLDAEQVSRGVAMVLEMQADVRRPWYTEWGDLIEMARVRNALSDKDYRRFMNQSAVIECSARGRIAKPDELPVIIKLKEARVGSSSQFVVMVEFDKVTIGGHDVEKREWAGFAGDYYGVLMGDSGNQKQKVAMLTLMSDQALNRMGFGALGGALTVSMGVPQAAQAGEREVQIGLRAQVVEFQRAMLGRGRRPAIDKEKAFSMGLASRTTVLADGEATVRVVPANEATAETLSRALMPQSCVYTGGGNRWSMHGGEKMLSITFCTAALPVQVAFDVFLREGEKEWKVGTFTSGSTGASEMDSMYWDAYTLKGPDRRSVWGNPNGWTFKKSVEMVLRPNVELAAKTIDQAEIYGGEVVLKNVPVDNVGE
jgi:hypothetical protein